MDNATRSKQTVALQRDLAKAIKLASAHPDEPEYWVDVATYAGNIQRRARLLAGLGRGG